MTQRISSAPRPESMGGISKVPTGIRGFDDVTHGGLPLGRATLVTGASGTGKTLFGLEFLVRGARDFGEPGVVLSFEESEPDLIANVSSLGFDLQDLVDRKLVAVDAFRLDPMEYVPAGEFDLEALFIRLASAIDSVGARRVVIDTVEVLFGALGNEATVRGEFHRLLRWLKARGLTAVITGERGREGQLTRYGIEEYVSDCVVVLDHRVTEEVATRRMRITKYRGSLHGVNEYPFLITERGFAVVPLTSVSLQYDAPTERVSMGIPRLDEMLGGGMYRGSVTLITGTAGTGKSTLSAHAAVAACQRGETALYLSFEESPAQIIRNMRSVGLDMDQHIRAGTLILVCGRPASSGLEGVLDDLDQLIASYAPDFIAMDSIGSLIQSGSAAEVRSIVGRHVDRLKRSGISALLTNLVERDDESSVFGVSSLVDTWLLLRNVESDGERNRLLFVIKSRGTSHSNQVREFVLSDQGPQLLDVELGPDGVLVGSARLLYAAAQRSARARELADVARRRSDFQFRQQQVESQIAELRRQLGEEEAQLEQLLAESRDEVQLRREASAQVVEQRSTGDRGAAVIASGVEEVRR